MKSVMLFLSAFLLSLLMVACSTPVAAQEVRSDQPRDTNPQTTPAELKELVAGNSAFAWALYQQVKGGGGNMFYSPYSLSVVLAMAYAGAKGDTANQMAAAMHYTLPQAELHEAFDYLALELVKREAITNSQGKPDTAFRLDVVNDLWGQKGYQFLMPFLNVLAIDYGAGLRIVDFVKNAEGARQVINQYVADNTNGRIKDLIPPGAVDSLTRLVLTNAIYFNATWATTFNKDATRDGSFFLDNSSQVTASMMHQTETLKYAAGSNYQAVELPYLGNQLAMDIVMPGAGQFSAFEGNLTADSMDSILSKLSGNSVILSLPKFQYSASFGLKPALAAMGMPIAFTDQADLSGIDGKRDLLITDVLHKAFVAVDENGTEAAAASAVIIGTTSMPVNQATMTVDHPFIFLIRDLPTGAILFIGRVMNPTAS
jgi:serpin B